MLKTITRTMAATVAAGLLAGAAHAQTAPRVYENGTVWQISHIETKPGMFDEYMAYLNGQWRASNEAGIKAGDIISYKILQVNAARDKEPDLILMIEFKNMAVFDASQADQDKRTAALWGSNQKAAQAQISREAMRVQRGGVLVRELKFQK
ncbi:MAG: hypothetical protein EPN98_11265 [Phenylobacterium sp.]|uniref:hypothetical protein n=1 Tax=Phenylobacterium sp. TaxID=1871053 RepID=UPI00120E8626|nr:hypothetical protein [Phenylobacterium sp.]TAL33580.1 MAG: hypothetical protein EPN98_11265 [Phenylobacterium sp.]